MISFSPGLAQGCFELLEIASRNALTFPQIRASFSSFGGLPNTKVIDAAQKLQWLSATDEGFAKITSAGSQLLKLTGYEPMLRQALLDYIEVERPPWVQGATYGRSKVLRFAGSEIVQVFIEAGLAFGVEEEIIAFWDEIAGIARGQKNSRLSNIGRQGERLSITYEQARTGHKPRWVAIDNNEDGYDLLSIVEAGDLRLLSIEVKTSTMGLSGLMHLTRNEWERSQEVDNHAFHLWALNSKIDCALAILTPMQMRPHIPSNSGFGSWESVEIPFSVFKEYFSDKRMS